MELEFITAAHWNDSLWELIEPMYQEAFPAGPNRQEFCTICWTEE